MAGVMTFCVGEVFSCIRRWFQGFFKYLCLGSVSEKVTSAAVFMSASFLVRKKIRCMFLRGTGIAKGICYLHCIQGKRGESCVR